MADYDWFDRAPKDPFDDEWYRLGFSEVNTSSTGYTWHALYECQGCFCLAKNYKAHWDSCDKAVKRSKEVRTVSKLEKK